MFVTSLPGMHFIRTPQTHCLLQMFFSLCLVLMSSPCSCPALFGSPCYTISDTICRSFPSCLFWHCHCYCLIRFLFWSLACVLHMGPQLYVLKVPSGHTWTQLMLRACMDSGNPGTQELVCRLSLSSTLTRPTASTSPAPPPFTPYPVSGR